MAAAGGGGGGAAAAASPHAQMALCDMFDRKLRPFITALVNTNPYAAAIPPARDGVAQRGRSAVDDHYAMTLTEADSRRVGTLGDMSCALHCTHVDQLTHVNVIDNAQVPLHSRNECDTYIQGTACLHFHSAYSSLVNPLYTNGQTLHSMRLVDAALVLLNPHVRFADMLAQCERDVGPNQQWNGGVLGVIQEQEVYDAVQTQSLGGGGIGANDFEEVFAPQARQALLSTLQLYARFVLALRLPSVCDVLELGAYDYTRNEMRNTVRNASMTDWVYCTTRLHRQVVEMLDVAIDRFMDKFNERWRSLRNANMGEHLRGWLRRITVRYLNFRYLDVHIVCDGASAVLNYLTSDCAVVYTSLMPHIKSTMQSKQNYGEYDLWVSNTRVRDPAPARVPGQRIHVRYTVNLLRRLSVLDTIGYGVEALSYVTRGADNNGGAAAAAAAAAAATDIPGMSYLFNGPVVQQQQQYQNNLLRNSYALLTCLLWRWTLLTHVQPVFESGVENARHVLASTVFTPFCDAVAAAASSSSPSNAAAASHRRPDLVLGNYAGHVFVVKHVKYGSGGDDDNVDDGDVMAVAAAAAAAAAAALVVCDRIELTLPFDGDKWFHNHVPYEIVYRNRPASAAAAGAEAADAAANDSDDQEHNADRPQVKRRRRRKHLQDDGTRKLFRVRQTTLFKALQKHVASATGTAKPYRNYVNKRYWLEKYMCMLHHVPHVRTDTLEGRGARSSEGAAIAVATARASAQVAAVAAAAGGGGGGGAAAAATHANRRVRFALDVLPPLEHADVQVTYVPPLAVPRILLRQLPDLVDQRTIDTMRRFLREHVRRLDSITVQLSKRTLSKAQRALLLNGSAQAAPAAAAAAAVLSPPPLPPTKRKYGDDDDDMYGDGDDDEDVLHPVPVAPPPRPSVSSLLVSSGNPTHEPLLRLCEVFGLYVYWMNNCATAVRCGANINNGTPFQRLCKSFCDEYELTDMREKVFVFQPHSSLRELARRFSQCSAGKRRLSNLLNSDTGYLHTLAEHAAAASAAADGGAAASAADEMDE